MKIVILIILLALGGTLFYLDFDALRLKDEGISYINEFKDDGVEKINDTKDDVLDNFNTKKDEIANEAMSFVENKFVELQIQFEDLTGNLINDLKNDVLDVEKYKVKIEELIAKVKSEDKEETSEDNKETESNEEDKNTLLSKLDELMAIFDNLDETIKSNENLALVQEKINGLLSEAQSLFEKINFK